RIELRAALYQAAQNQASVEVIVAPVEVEGEKKEVAMRVSPARDVGADLYLVALQTSSPSVTSIETARSGDDPVARQLDRELERLKSHLRDTVEQYEASTEELKASNEELQAMNEELRSAAEELETSREELQSINEELTTVNQELNVKVDEVSKTSNNLRNLVNSTNIATIFLDRAGHIHLFSRAVRDIFNLLATDIGRPLSDITTKLLDVDMVADAMFVLDTLNSIEREVRTDESRSYLMRMLPYRTSEDRIKGVVATFTDITERKRAE